MSPYAPTASEQLKDIEQAVLRALKQHNRQMDELLESLHRYSSAAVKYAVWHLIDRGEVFLERDRSLRRAA